MPCRCALAVLPPIMGSPQNGGLTVVHDHLHDERCEANRAALHQADRATVVLALRDAGANEREFLEVQLFKRQCAAGRSMADAVGEIAAIALVVSSICAQRSAIGRASARLVLLCGHKTRRADLGWS